MALFDLRKRRTKKDAPPANLTVVEATAVVPIAEPPAPVLAPLAPVTPTEWSPALQEEALGLVPRGQDLLVLGLAPWAGQAWPQRLLGRVRAMVAVDPDRARLTAVRAYCHKTIEAPLDGADWLARLGNQRFGTVLLGDALTHLLDPVAFMRRVHELVSPDGQVIAIVPNAAWGEHRLTHLQGELPRGYEPGTPLHHYNHDRLREALALAGFELAEVRAFHTPLFQAEGGLVPELFPDAVLAALGPQHDATVSHLVIRALPTSADVLLRTLFGEQEQLRKAVRNELAKAGRTHDALTHSLKLADRQKEELTGELEDQRKKVSGLAELAARAEQNVRRLGKEVDDAQRELRAIKDTFAYRVARWFSPALQVPAELPGAGPTEWKVEAPKDRYPQA